MPQNTRRYFEEAEQLLEGRKPEGPEFAALMRSKVGDRFKHLVTPERLGMMALIGNPRAQHWNVAGLNFPKGLGSFEDRYRMWEELYPVLRETKQKTVPEGKRIFGVGRHADAGTYAHELRHEAVEDELYNRTLDLIHGSTSLPAYRANVDRMFTHLVDFDRDAVENTSYADKEKAVFNSVGHIIRDEARSKSDLGLLSSLMSNGAIEKNMELNKAGAVGGFLGGKELPGYVIQHRAKLPFLNFIGRIEDPAPEKKASGGAVENTTHDRKII
jgi:hypothetical protein